jgi:hypothetical protein
MSSLLKYMLAIAAVFFGEGDGTIALLVAQDGEKCPKSRLNTE